MGNLIDLSGLVFGRLTVISLSHKKNGKPYWSCKCLCGKDVTARGDSLKIGRIKSCGCYIREIKKTSTRKHGLYKTPEYKAWSGIKDRCFNPKNEEYHNYGGRGITVCKEWIESFSCFYQHVGKKPTPDHSIDRINNDGNYEPGNCKWSTYPEQQRNRSNNRVLTHNGESLIFTEWAKRLNIPEGTLFWRLKTKSISEIINDLK